MIYFTRLAAGITLLFSSFFGHHTSVSISIPPQASSSSSVTTTSATSDVQVSNATTTSTSGTKTKSSILSSLVSIGSVLNNSIQKAETAPKNVQTVNTPQPSSNSAVQSSPSSTTSVPAQSSAPIGINTIDQADLRSSVPAYSGGDSVPTAMYSSITLSGKSSNASTVDIALVDPSISATDWATVSAAATAHIGTAPVANGIWSVTWKGIPSGSYTVLIYNDASHTLLMKGSVHVTAPSSLSFTSNPKIPTTLGLGQEVTDGIITIKLTAVSQSGTATLTISDTDSGNNEQPSFYGKVFTASAGTVFPSTPTGFDDSTSPTSALSITVVSVSPSLKTIVLTTAYTQEGSLPSGAPAHE